jgi:hypothetical protein
MSQTAVAVQEDVVVAPKVFENASQGMHVGTITRVEDQGIVNSDQYGPRRRVKIHVRIDDEKSSKGEQLNVFTTMTASTLGPKSRLGIFLRQLGVPTNAELHLKELVGMKIYANIVHNPVDGKVYANIESVARYRTAPPAGTVEQI